MNDLGESVQLRSRGIGVIHANYRRLDGTTLYLRWGDASALLSILLLFAYAGSLQVQHFKGLRLTTAFVTHPTFLLHRAHSRKPASDDDPSPLDPTDLRHDRSPPEGTPTEIESSVRPVDRDAACAGGVRM